MDPVSIVVATSCGALGAVVIKLGEMFAAHLRHKKIIRRRLEAIQ